MSSASGNDAAANDQAAAFARWTDDEDAQLADEVRRGFSEELIADRHGRSVGAIRHRVQRMIPADEHVSRWKALEWVRTHLAVGGYDWRAVLATNAPTRHRHQAAAEAQVAPAQEVHPRQAPQDSRQRKNAREPGVSGEDAQRIALVQRLLATRNRSNAVPAPTAPSPEVRVLARYSNTQLFRAGRRVCDTQGRLPLHAWALECLYPGLPEMTVSTSEVLDGAPEAGFTIRELVAAAITEIRQERDQQVLTNRLGLSDTEPQTLAALGRRLDVSRERVRQLQERALSGLSSRRLPPVCARTHARSVLSALLEQADTDRGGTAAVLLAAAEAAFTTVQPGLVASVLVRLAGGDNYAGKHHAAEVANLARIRTQQTTAEARKQRFTAHADTQVGRMLEAVEWPLSTGATVKLPRLRDPSPDQERHGHWYSAARDQSIGYDSRAELKVIQLLDRSGHVADIREQPIALGYRLDGRHRTYYPDLLITTADDRMVLVEVKPARYMALAGNRAKYAAARAACREHGWGFLVTDGHTHLRDLLDRPTDEATERQLRETLAAGQLRWTDIRKLRDQRYFTHRDLSALILRYGWDWRLEPYRLASTGDNPR